MMQMCLSNTVDGCAPTCIVEWSQCQLLQVTGQVIIYGLGLKMFNPDESSDLNNQDVKVVPQTVPHIPGQARLCYQGST